MEGKNQNIIAEDSQSQASSLVVSDYEALSSESDREKVEFIANAKKLLDAKISAKFDQTKTENK